MNYAQDRLDRRELVSLLSSPLTTTTTTVVPLTLPPPPPQSPPSPTPTTKQNHHETITTTIGTQIVDDGENDSKVEKVNDNSSRSMNERTATTTPTTTKVVDHSKYGQRCMVLGWNTGALYHYGRAWYEQPTNDLALGDYVQMMEFAGYPELALLTIFHYRTMHVKNINTNTNDDTDNDDDDDTRIRTKFLIPPPPPSPSSFVSDSSSSIDNNNNNNNDDDDDDGNRYNKSAFEMIGHHCGCHDHLCGHINHYSKHCNNNNTTTMATTTTTMLPSWIPMPPPAMQDIVRQFQRYCQQRVVRQYHHQQCVFGSNDGSTGSTTTTDIPSVSSSPTTTIITAHELLGEWTTDIVRRQRLITYIHDSTLSIPEIFQFWNPETMVSTTTTITNNQKQQQYRSFQPVVQLLCIKLLYLIIPSLAMEAVVHVRYQQQQHHHQQQERVGDDNDDDRIRASSLSLPPKKKKNSRTMEFFWDKQQLSNQYKSHWAYYILIEALVLGERIKPFRRTRMTFHHVALWDRLWGLLPAPIIRMRCTGATTTTTTGTTEPTTTTTSRGTTDHSTTTITTTTATTIGNTGIATQSNYKDTSVSTVTVACSHHHQQLVNTFIRQLTDLVDWVDNTTTPPDQTCHGNTHHTNASTHAMQPPTALPVHIWMQPFCNDPHHHQQQQLSTAMSNHRPLFLLGDSHALSLAWQSICLPSSSSTNLHSRDNIMLESRWIVPIVITGLKAWHVRSETRFFTNTCLHTTLRRLPSDVQTIIISAGEIDCREGMGGPLLQGYTQECHHHITATVDAFISALVGLIRLPSNAISQILITPVAPHIERNKGRVVGQASRRETVRVWNNELRRQLIPHKGTMYLLDYIDQIQVPIKKANDKTASATNTTLYALNPIFNADATHLNGAFAPILRDAIVRCQCDLSKL